LVLFSSFILGGLYLNSKKGHNKLVGQSLTADKNNSSKPAATTKKRSQFETGFGLTKNNW